MKSIEIEVLAHRYLYYVLGTPVISDPAYDELERSARAVAGPDSPVHGVGSSNPHDYPQKVVSRANDLLNDY